MDIRNVYIIYSKEFTKDKIIQEIKAERWEHNFVFFSDITSGKDKIRYMGQANEIWCFGDCTHIQDYKDALIRNKDFWRMG